MVRKEKIERVKEEARQIDKTDPGDGWIERKIF